jgi:hypothetical protein
MSWELLFRFVLGGTIVSLFSVVGDLFKPKTFAGIFSAAPSVALATLTLAYFKKGGAYVATLAHAMLLGAFALTAYSVVSGQLLRHYRLPPWLEAIAGWLVWLAVALGFWALFLRS